MPTSRRPRKPWRGVASTIAVAFTALGPVGCGGDGGSSTTASAPEGPPAATLQRLKDCLGSGNFDVIGGVPKPPVPAPAAELIVTRGKGGPGAILAIYATAEQAKAAAPAIKTNLDKASPKGSPGGIEQRGAVNVLWTPDPPVASTRRAALACLPG